MDRRSLLKAAAVLPASGLAGAALATKVGEVAIRAPYSVAQGSVIEVSRIAGVSFSWIGEHGSTGATIQALVNGVWGAPQEVFADHGHGPEDPTGRIHGPLHIDDDVEAYRITAVAGADLKAHELPKSLRLAPLANATTVIEPIPGLEIQPRNAWTTRERRHTGDCTLGSSLLGLGCRTDVALRHAMIHHTVNSNSYSQSSVPSMLRSIQNYHMDSRGWDDIGYNFVVDRFGTVWHGRSGDAEEPITAGHTLGFNVESVGIAVLGNFESGSVPSAVVESVGALVGWKLGRSGVDPLGETFVRNTSTDTVDRIDTVSGHRDLGSTSCPGRYLYAELDDIKARAAQEVSMYGFAEPEYEFDNIHFTGWAINPSNLTEKVPVDFTADGDTTTVAADQSYPRLGSWYPGAGWNHGFDVSVPITLDTRSVQVTATGNDGKVALLADLTLFAGFIDVEADQFFAEGVYFMRQHEITRGTGPGLFEPMDIVNRAQMATFLHRLMDLPEASSSSGFSDVEAGSYYEDAVNWLAETGITTGTSATTYSPLKEVTRAQMATFLWRLCGEIQATSTSPFSDVASGVYYEDAVNWIAEIGVTTGTSATTFSPNRAITRGQMATFLVRLANAAEAWTVVDPPSAVQATLPPTTTTTTTTTSSTTTTLQPD